MPFAWRPTLAISPQRYRGAIDSTETALLSTLKWSDTVWAAGMETDWARSLACAPVDSRTTIAAPLQDQVELLCKAVPVKFMPFRLFDLPQELQDLVFAFAYPAESTTRWIFPTEWHVRETEKRRRSLDYVTKPFPRFKIDDWLVSKRYFVGAATAQIGSTIWKTPRYFRMTNDVATQMLRQFIQTIEVDFYQIVEVAVSWPGLRHLTVTIGHEWANLCDKIGKYVWQEDFTDMDIQALLGCHNLTAISGLWSFSLKVGNCTYADTDHARKLLNANATRVEAFLRRRVLKTRLVTDTQVQSASRPLYCGSKVNWPVPRTDELESNTAVPAASGAIANGSSQGALHEACPQKTAPTAFTSGSRPAVALRGGKIGLCYCPRSTMFDMSGPLRPTTNQQAAYHARPIADAVSCKCVTTVKAEQALLSRVNSIMQGTQSSAGLPLGPERQAAESNSHSHHVLGYPYQLRPRRVDRLDRVLTSRHARAALPADVAVDQDLARKFAELLRSKE